MVFETTTGAVIWDDNNDNVAGQSTPCPAQMEMCFVKNILKTIIVNYEDNG